MPVQAALAYTFPPSITGPTSEQLHFGSSCWPHSCRVWHISCLFSGFRVSLAHSDCCSSRTCLTLQLLRSLHIVIAVQPYLVLARSCVLERSQPRWSTQPWHSFGQVQSVAAGFHDAHLYCTHYLYPLGCPVIYLRRHRGVRHRLRLPCGWLLELVDRVREAHRK